MNSILRMQAALGKSWNLVKCQDWKTGDVTIIYDVYHTPWEKKGEQFYVPKKIRRDGRTYPHGNPSWNAQERKWEYPLMGVTHTRISVGNDRPIKGYPALVRWVKMRALDMDMPEGAILKIEYQLYLVSGMSFQGHWDFPGDDRYVVRNWLNRTQMWGNCNQKQYEKELQDQESARQATILDLEIYETTIRMAMASRYPITPNVPVQTGDADGDIQYLQQLEIYRSGNCPADDCCNCPFIHKCEG